MFKLATLTALLVLLHGHDERLKDENGNYIGRGCGTEEYNEELLANDPEWQASLDEFEEFWAERSAAIQSGEYKLEENQQSLLAPIVWHIVYNSNNQNVPDSAIAYQLNVLNNDFAGTNSDFTVTPQEFRGVAAGNTQISYITQQVIRTPTSVSSFSSNNNIKFTSSGGSNVVSPNMYLNNWYGPLSGGLLGYAQFPGGNSATDGVVNAFGTIAPTVGNPPFNLGRTATHEIGHWLNLRHIWGDNTGCTNTESISDFVIDTPPSTSPNSGCPSGVKRCSANPYSQDMWCNYMDYTNDQCMVMFTALQNARAQASIQQYRGGFGMSNFKTTDESFISWIYFMRFEAEPLDEDKCVGNDIMFYDNDINEDSDSAVFIYGCMQKVQTTHVGHITKMYFTDSECNDGDSRASQDLNEGNDNPIYICYDKVDSINDGEKDIAILDITFIRDDDTSKLDLDQWEVGTQNINPNGIKLNFAMKKGKFLEDENVKAEAPTFGDVANITSKDGIYIGVGVGLFLLASVLVGVVICRCRRKDKFMKEYMNEALSNEYGATTELTKVAI